jgi:selenocysteine lyase/cysteine desulfurase
VVQIHGPQTTHRRGGTIAFDFLRRDGRLVDVRLVDSRAAEHGVSLRTGCFCNPGSAELVYELPLETLLRRTGSPSSSDHLRALGVESGGAVRVSLGVATTFRDVYRFMHFASTFAA